MSNSFSIDSSEIARLGQRVEQAFQSLPHKVADAMSYAAYDARDEVKRQTPTYVRNPTPWTMNATFVRRAKPSNLVVDLGFKDEAPKGTPAAKYLQPIVAGTPRRPKSTERQLQSAGLLRPGQFIVPTGVTPLRLNQYGNIAGGTYTQVLSRLKALGQQGYSGNVSGAARSQGKRSARDYFVGGPGGLPRGIQARVGPRPKGNPRGMGRPVTSNLPRGFHTVFYITRQPSYSRTFPAQRIMLDKFNERFPSIFERIVMGGR